MPMTRNEPAWTCIWHLLDQIPYQEPRPVQIELPPRQPDTDYKRPEKSTKVSSRGSIEPPFYGANLKETCCALPQMVIE